MRKISLSPIPNQRFTVVINGFLWDISIRTAQNCMFVDILKDGDVVIQGQRLLSRQPVIPYRYLSLDGNFVMTTQNNEYPIYTRFEVDQEFFYLEPSEVLDD